jgi:hypothetical protein
MLPWAISWMIMEKIKTIIENIAITTSIVQTQ